MARVLVTSVRVGNAERARPTRVAVVVWAGLSAAVVLLLVHAVAPLSWQSDGEAAAAQSPAPGERAGVAAEARALSALSAKETAAAPVAGAPAAGGLSGSWGEGVEVTVFADGACAGPQATFGAGHSEQMCTRCFDVCGKKFADGSTMHSAQGSQVRSLRVRGAAAVSTAEGCLGTYRYSGDQAGGFVTEEDGCVQINAPGHIKMNPLPPPATPAELVLSGDVGGAERVVFYQKKHCKGRAFVAKMDDRCGDDGVHSDCLNMCRHKLPGGADMAQATRSVRVFGDREVDLFSDCDGSGDYWSSVFESDGCVNLYDWPRTSHMARVRRNSLSNRTETLRPRTPPRFRVAWSGESSSYFAFQTQANRYAFETTGQAEDGGAWLRLMTSSRYDDLSAVFPTFAAKRHPYSRRYSPLNKGDVLVKWFASADAPGPEEIIVLIDPDNWLLRPLTPHLELVKRGAASAQAAWYVGSRPSVTEMWKQFCEENCDWHLDLVAVPIFVHRDDLEVISPLWRKYSLLIKERLEWDQDFLKRYTPLQVDWCAEMYGYVFAAAHAGIRHTVLPVLQVRDVDSPPTPEQQRTVPMIHMGRAWFPRRYGCRQWCHTEGKPWAYRGEQVWCKCNDTASDVLPWPLPDGEMDFVSKHTLRILHYAREKYGPIGRSPMRSRVFSETYP
eukprot:TRINITY_DN29384_c0_g1_i1.p1 TRINITY_DN29384_c0_g1~~TRINITY_DN29384_c0_g1_i1.p1  ORF type:complete len:671 (+),score=142.36 TRINITY_DN29384_c0_g1_i1:57-2069(+)